MYEEEVCLHRIHLATLCNLDTPQKRRTELPLLETREMVDSVRGLAVNHDWAQRRPTTTAREEDPGVGRLCRFLQAHLHASAQSSSATDSWLDLWDQVQRLASRSVRKRSRDDYVMIEMM
jgi:hypothetical protein